MIKLTEEQYLEVVKHGLKIHISRDSSVEDESDIDYEDRNLADFISRELRLYGFEIPKVGKK